MSSEIAISARELSKSFPVFVKPHHRLLQMLMPRRSSRFYREFHALRDVNFEIGKGETVGIVGRNGSGKSTLLQLICGTLSPTRGEILVNGRIAALLELGAGFNPEFTGRENVNLNATVLGLSRQEIDDRFDEIAEFADIGEFMEQPVKSYSSGMYVRLAFAVAIHVDPDILVVDEALSVGDEAFQRKCFARIEAIRNRGATILFVSHSAAIVVDLCDRAILIDQGELLATGKPKSIVSSYQRMLHAPADAVPAIREEIRAASSAGPAEATSPLSEAVPGSARVSDPYWDEGLTVVSTIAYENRGATISDARIETRDGRRVNVLVAGKTYVYKYNVAFVRAVSGVRCGMMIKTVTGAELGGSATAAVREPKPSFRPGEHIEISFSFECLFANGVYFMNAGVLGLIDEEEEFLDRRVDVLMFRVENGSPRVTGFVDFNFSSDIRELS